MTVSLTDAERIHLAGFRAVLHEWARRHLEEKSEHVGPYEILRVAVDYDRGNGSPDTPADDTLAVSILFKHAGDACPVLYNCESPGSAGWWMPDTMRSVEMLNELLVIADEG
jgi:hypothetical protein